MATLRNNLPLEKIVFVASKCLGRRLIHLGQEL